VGGPLTVLRAEKRLREMRPAAKLSTRRRRLRVFEALSWQNLQLAPAVCF